MNIDYAFTKAFQNSMTGNSKERTVEQTITLTTDQPTIEVINESAPITIDGLIQNMIEANVPDAISDEVYDRAVEAIEDYDFDSLVERVIENYDFSYIVEDNVQNAIENVTPYGWDWDNIVTEEAFSSFREEVEAAIENVASPDNSELERRVAELETQLSDLITAINDFGRSV